MGISCGIVGLPNVGKSTLFNALLKKQQAFVANYPFATIEPNVGIVPVPDDRLTEMAKVTKDSESLDHLPPQIPATVEFVDIAGLVAGASSGEGLGNKFLSHIREVDAIVHVLRAFNDPDIVKHGVVSPKSDFETIKTELDLADLETIEKRKKKERKGEIKEELALLSKKPILVVLNVDETDLKSASSIEERAAVDLGVDKDSVVAICAKTESELAGLTDNEQRQYLKELGISSSGLERLIKKAFATLGLITFLTAGEKEVRAWTIKKGLNARVGSGVIHTDFMKKFIKADVASYDDFIKYGGWKACRQTGKVRSEGRDYTIQDGDVIEFKIGS